MIFQLPPLNALASDQLVQFIETKLTAHGVKKVVPDNGILAETFQATRRADKVRRLVEQALATEHAEPHLVPDNLRERVVQLLLDNPAMRWHDAVAAIASGEW
jgi:hypothetical protein